METGNKKNRMAERASKLNQPQDIYKNVIQNQKNTENTVSNEPINVVEITNYSLALPTKYHKFLRKTAFENDTSLKALIISAIENTYPEINK